MSFRKDISPTGAIADFRAVWRGSGKQRWLILALSCLPVFFILYGIAEDVRKKSIPGPRPIIYVESWSLDRSREEILADQRVREKLRLKQEEERKARYRALGRASGMDVDAIQAEIDAEQTAKETAPSDKNDAAAAKAGPIAKKQS